MDANNDQLVSVKDASSLVIARLCVALRRARVRVEAACAYGILTLWQRLPAAGISTCLEADLPHCHLGRVAAVLDDGRDDALVLRQARGVLQVV